MEPHGKDRRTGQVILPSMARQARQSDSFAACGDGPAFRRHRRRFRSVALPDLPTDLAQGGEHGGGRGRQGQVDVQLGLPAEGPHGIPECLAEIQVRQLFGWAESIGRVIPEADFEALPLVSDETSEHEVRFRDSDRRVIKKTWPGTFGMAPGSQGHGTNFKIPSDTPTPRPLAGSSSQ